MNGVWTATGRACLALAMSCLGVALAAGQVGSSGGGQAGPPDVIDPSSGWGPLDPVWVCFDPATPPPPDYMDQIHMAIWAQFSQRYNLDSRWGGTQGDPITLTWSFVPDGVQIPQSNFDEPQQGNQASNLVATLDSQFPSRNAWVSQFQACFDRWEELTGINFVRVTPNGSDVDDGAAWGTAGDGVNRGDIRIGGKCIDGRGGTDCAGGVPDNFNTLAYNQFPANGGDMVLDTAENWSSGGTELFLRNVVMHEMGHGIGLRHVCPTNNTILMEPFINLGFDGPQHDDIRAGQRFYGDPFEIDDSSGSATNLGVVDAGFPIAIGAEDFPAPAVVAGSIHSIDEDDEEDFFRFTVNDAETLTLSVVPIGLTYDSSTQNSDGSCNSGNFINSAAIGDFVLEVIDTDGSTVLASADNSGAGGTETVNNVSLPAAGEYFIRVTSANSPDQSQLYGMRGSVNQPPVAVCQDFSAPADGNCCITVDVADIDGGSFDPDGAQDIVSICITRVDGVPVNCLQSVTVCDDGTFGPHTVELTITDREGATDSCEATVFVDDQTPPTIVCSIDNAQDPVEVDDNCEATLLFTAVITDNCCVDANDLDLVTTATDLNGFAVFVENPPTITSVVQDSSTQVTVRGSVLVSGLTGCPANIEITVQADDCAENTSEVCRTSREVVDRIAPVLICPPDIFLERGDKICNDDVQNWLDSYVVSDNCDPDVEVVNDAPECGFPPGSTTLVTWTATDDCGNITQCSATITIAEAGTGETSKRGSLLVYPDVEARWNAAGDLVQDTFLTVVNDYPADVHVFIYFVDEDCGRLYSDRDLTHRQPQYWSAATGQPFGIAGIGSLPRRPDPEGSGEFIVRGSVILWATNLEGHEIRWNALTGSATVVNYAAGTSFEYTPWAFVTECVEHGEEPLDCIEFDANGTCCQAVAIPGNIDFDGFQYDLGPNTLVLDYIAAGSTAYSKPGIPVTHDTDLTIHILDKDLRQDNEGPVVTKVRVNAWNADETSFATEYCISCWDQRLISSIGGPFLRNILQTDNGYAVLDGQESTVCEFSREASLLGVQNAVLTFPGNEKVFAGETLRQRGQQAGNLKYDVPGPPEELTRPLERGSGGTQR